MNLFFWRKKHVAKAEEELIDSYTKVAAGLDFELLIAPVFRQIAIDAMKYQKRQDYPIYYTVDLMNSGRHL